MVPLKNTLIIVVLLVFGSSYSGQAQSTDKFDLDKTYSIDADGSLALSSDDADVTIVGSNRSDVHVEIHYTLEVTGFSFGNRNKFGMEVREVNGNLEIKEKPRNFNGITFGSSDEDYTIRIEVPQGVSLSLNGDDENYNIRKINGSIRIDADDAEARLTACRGNAFSFDLDDGSINMDGGSGSLKIDVDDGEADIRNGHFDAIQLDSDDGDFIIYTSLKDGGSYNFDMDDGDLAFYVTGGGGTFTIQHDDADISADSAFEQTVDEEHESAYRLGHGTATIRMDVDDADIVLHKTN